MNAKSTPRLGYLLLADDNERRNASALLVLAVIWALGAMCSIGEEILWIWFGPPAVLLGFSVRSFFRAKRKRRAVEVVWKECAGVEEVGPLLRAMDRKDDYGNVVAKKALLRLLPTLGEQDAGTISPADQELMRRRLRAAVRSYPSPDLLLTRAILAAQAEIGTPPVLPIAEEMARRAAYPELREAATELLPAIRARVARAADLATLLRASAADADNNSLLVRPAANGSSSEPDHLLRPTD